MNGDQSCTDEDLHRFIDGELDDESRSRVQALLEKDPSLAARLGEYQSVDQAVREAFGTVAAPAGNIAYRSMWPTGRGVAAAVLLLSAGFGTGWLVHSLQSIPEMHGSLAGGVTLPVPGSEQLNTLFHIDMDDKGLMEGVLNRAEAVLTAFAGQHVQVEVVANAEGLNLVRADTSPFADRVRAMMDKYDNLAFVACAKSIKRLKDKGVDVLLIDRTHASETAVDHVVARLRAGWTYVKI